MNSQIKVIKILLYCVVVFVYLWAGWLGYECHRLKSILKNDDSVSGELKYTAQTQEGKQSGGQGGSAEKIRELKEKLRNSENAARQATDDWLQRQAVSFHIHRWDDDIPTQDVSLEEVKTLAPEQYEDILKLANEIGEENVRHKAARQAFVEAIKAEWLTGEEHRQLQMYVRILDIFDNDDVNGGELSREERKKLKDQAVSYWQVQEIVKKCCRRMVGDDGEDRHWEEEVDRIRSFCMAPTYEFVLPAKAETFPK